MAFTLYYGSCPSYLQSLPVKTGIKGEVIKCAGFPNVVRTNCGRESQIAGGEWGVLQYIVHYVTYQNGYGGQRVYVLMLLEYLNNF